MASFTGGSSAPQITTLEAASDPTVIGGFTLTPWLSKANSGTFSLNPPSTSGGSGGSAPPTTGLLWPRTRT